MKALRTLRSVSSSLLTSEWSTAPWIAEASASFSSAPIVDQMISYVRQGPADTQTDQAVDILKGGLQMPGCQDGLGAARYEERRAHNEFPKFCSARCNLSKRTFLIHKNVILTSPHRLHLEICRLEMDRGGWASAMDRASLAQTALRKEDPSARPAAADDALVSAAVLQLRCASAAGSDAGLASSAAAAQEVSSGLFRQPGRELHCTAARLLGATQTAVTDFLSRSRSNTQTPSSAREALSLLQQQRPGGEAAAREALQSDGAAVASLGYMNALANLQGAVIAAIGGGDNQLAAELATKYECLFASKYLLVDVSCPCPKSILRGHFPSPLPFFFPSRSADAIAEVDADAAKSGPSILTPLSILNEVRADALLCKGQVLLRDRAFDAAEEALTEARPSPLPISLFFVHMHNSITYILHVTFFCLTFALRIP